MSHISEQTEQAELGESNISYISLRTPWTISDSATRASLEATSHSNRLTVQWAASVRDHRGQKTSKKCCIFRGQHVFDETSSEDEVYAANDNQLNCQKGGCRCKTRFA